MVKRMAAVWVVSLLLVGTAGAGTVEKWGRFSVSYRNSRWEGNPFDVELRGIFTSPTGRVLTQWGFHAGGDVWCLYFMPDEEGTWSFRTVSSDADLDGKEGTLVCSASSLPGKLVADGSRWRLSDAGGDAPVIWNPPTADDAQWGFRGRELSDRSVGEAIDLADEVVGARVIGIDELLIVPTGWARDWPQDSVPYVVGREGEEFHLPFWDRLNAKLDAIRDRGMGHYIMFYSDDELTPDIFGMTPGSQAELRFFRYAVARLACYPIVLWDSGIDISEYRDRSWCDWFVGWFNEHDPWQHPTGSRGIGVAVEVLTQLGDHADMSWRRRVDEIARGALLRGDMPEGATYHSSGGWDIPSRAELLCMLALPVPTAHTDHWRPFIGRGDWTQDKIRTVLWRCALSGGQACCVDYNQGVLDKDTLRVGSAYIGHCTRFFREELRCDIAELHPHDELIVAGENAIVAAKPGAEYVLYDFDGGTVVVDLSHASAELTARWYNPRRGEFVAAAEAVGGGQAAFNAPTGGSGNDWVLHLILSEGELNSNPGSSRALR